VLVKSGRVSDIGIHRKGEEKPVTLSSNTITLRIVPAEKEWQQQKLAAIASTLAATHDQMFSPESSPRKQAASDLRFLGTEEAIDLLTQYYREDKRDVWGQCEMGLRDCLSDCAHRPWRRSKAHCRTGVSGLFKPAQHGGFPAIEGRRSRTRLKMIRERASILGRRKRGRLKKRHGTWPTNRWIIRK